VSEKETTPESGARTFTQEDVDRIVAERLRREREKYADYDDLKAKAAAADASKSELQKLAERLAAAEKRMQEAEVKALRAEVAAAKGVPADLLHGSTKEELEAYADRLVQFRGGTQTAEAATKDGNGQDGTGVDERKVSGRPKEKLTAGAVPAAGGDKSPAELAEQILKSGF